MSSHVHVPPQDDGPAPNWEQIAQDADFRKLLKSKAKFLVSATLFFMLYYFALPVLVGFAPALMEVPVIGKANLAYLFALSQFLMAWILAGIYVRVAMGWDRKADAILRKFRRK